MATIGLRVAHDADFASPRVLTTDLFNYVSLWLRRRREADAQFFWEQSEHFYRAAATVPVQASPLLYYYSFLNAGKALLSVKKEAFSPSHHGLSSPYVTGRANIQNDVIVVQQQGAFPALHRYYSGQSLAYRSQFRVKDLLRNVACVHAAYKSTFASHAAEPLFLPAKKHEFVESAGDLRFELTIQEKETNLADAAWRRSLRPWLSQGFEFHSASAGQALVKHTGLFNASALAEATKLIRRDIHVILDGRDNIYYLHRRAGKAKLTPVYDGAKIDFVRVTPANGSLPWSQLPLLLAIMFHFGSLVRYNPKRIAGMLATTENWLISEFIELAPAQFLGMAAAEITRQEFARPYALSA